MTTVVVAVGAGDGEVDALGLTVGAGVADGAPPGVHDAGAVVAEGDGLADGVTAAVEPVALNVVPKIPASTSAAEIAAMICRKRLGVVM